MRKKMIYVVDDERDLAEILTLHLQDHGFDSLWEEDSRIALAEIPNIRPDLLVTDMQMPFVTGVDIIERLFEVDPKTPVIMITGFAHKAGSAAFELSRVHILQKPFDLGEMVTLANSLLGEKTLLDYF